MSDGQTATLDEVAYLSKAKFTPNSDDERKYIALENIDPGSGWLKSVGSSKGAKSQKAVFNTGDILFNKLRPYLKKYWLATFDGVCTTELLVIKNRESIDRSFLYYIVSDGAFIKYINAKTFGTKMPRADWNIVKGYQLWLPPITSQVKISSILCTVDSTIAATQNAIKQAELLKEGLLQQLIDLDGETQPLQDIILDITGGVSVRSDDKPVSNPEERGVLKTSAVSYLTFDSSQNKTVHKDQLRRLATPVRKDTILVSRMNTPELVGANVYVERDFPQLFLPDRIWQLRIKDTTSPLWVSYVLQKHFKQGRVGSLASGTSMSMRNISQEKYLSLKIPVISPSEQDKQAELLEMVDQVILVNKKIREIQERLKQGLMQDLLTGKVRV